VLASAAVSAIVGTQAMGEVAPAGRVIDVAAGGSFQQALNSALPGDTIRLAPGATYIGNFWLPAKNGSEYILVTTRDAVLPPAGVRIDPSYKPRLAVLRSPSTPSVLTTAAGASYYRFVGVAFEANKNGAGDIIALGKDAQTTIAQVPHHIEFDRVLVAGDPTVGQKRGISLNASHVTIINSDFREFKAVGQEAQAICGWNTPGQIVIRNNFLEAAGENIMFGGANINIPGAIPSDIIVENNHMTKNPAWKGTSWTVKNLFELKNAQRVVVRRNVLQYNWDGAQPGYAVVFSPRNTSKNTPWVVVQDVEFSGNIVSHSGSAFNILGFDDTAPSGQAARINISNNLVFEINHTVWGGAGVFAQLGGEPKDVTFDHNTILHTGNIVTFYSGKYTDSAGVRRTGGPITGFRFTNNLVKHNAYGIFGSGRGYGDDSLTFYAPGAVVTKNAIASDKSIASRYPAGNTFPTLAAFDAAFHNAAAFDFRLTPASTYRLAGTDGKDLGCDFTSLLAVSRPSPPARVRIATVQ
jgi:hypothetical protein